MKKRPFQRDIKIPCSSCRKETWHWIVWSDVEMEEKYEDQSISYFHQRIECCGCGNRINRDFKTRSEDNSEFEIRISPAYDTWYKKPKAELLSNLPEKVAIAYNEVIETYNSRNNLSCAAMVLHTLEGMGSGVKIELEQSGENPLNIKLDMISKKLTAKGLITKTLADILLGLGFIGNKAKHSLEYWGSGQLDIAIMVMEHILQNMVIKGIYDDLLENINKSGRRQ